MEMSLKSLMARLLLIVSVALVPALVVQAYSEGDARHSRQQLVEDEAQRFVRLVASEQQRIVEGAEQVLNVISSSPSVQDNSAELCQRLLANLLQQSPRYNFAGVIGTDGHTVCAPGPFDRSLDASDRAYFRRALETGGLVIGDYTVGRLSRQPTIHIAKPLRNRDGTIAGRSYSAHSCDSEMRVVQGADLAQKSGVTTDQTTRPQRVTQCPHHMAHRTRQHSGFRRLVARRWRPRSTAGGSHPMAASCCSVRWSGSSAWPMRSRG
jgi:hypothetical protein